MSARFVCPNDGEVLNVGVDPSTNPASEFYVCAYCGYKSTKANTAKLSSVDETYVPSSKSGKEHKH